MNIPNLPNQFTPFVQNGAVHPDWYQYLSQLTNQLQGNFSQEGTAVPTQSAQNISTIEATNPHSSFVFDSDSEKLKFAVNGTYKTVTLT